MTDNKEKKKKIVMIVAAVLLLVAAVIIFLYFRSQIRATTEGRRLQIQCLWELKPLLLPGDLPLRRYGGRCRIVVLWGTWEG